LQQNYFIWHEKRERKSKIGHRKSEEKGEFDSPKNESLCFKGGTPIMHGLVMVGYNIFVPKKYLFTYLKNENILQKWLKWFKTFWKL
jgi:hypothetical protein